MLVPIRRGTNMASHTKLCNFPWYIFSNNSIRRYRPALWLSHIVYVSLFYNISISWLYLLNGWRFYFFTCVMMCEVKTTYRVNLLWCVLTTALTTKGKKTWLNAWLNYGLETAGKSTLSIILWFSQFLVGAMKIKIYKQTNKKHNTTNKM